MILYSRILMVDALLILWHTKYFGPLETACTAYTRCLRLSILLNTQYFVIRYWVYSMLKVRNKNNKQRPYIDVQLLMSFSPPPRYTLIAFFPHFLSLWHYFSPFWIGYFQFGFFRVARWCALPVARRSDLDVLSFTSAIYFSFCISFILRQYSISDTIVDNCSTGIRTAYWRVKGEGISVYAVWCSVHWARLSITAAIRSTFGGPYSLYYAIRSIFGGSILLVLSNTQYFQGLDIAHTKHYAVFSMVDIKGYNWCILNKKY